MEPNSMINLISSAIAGIGSLLKGLQVKQVLAGVLVGFILLSTSTVGSEPVGRDALKKVDKIVHQDDSQRPKTTREWKGEARATQNEPGKRAERIGEETADALKDWGKLYPDVAKRSIPALRDDAR